MAEKLVVYNEAFKAAWVGRDPFEWVETLSGKIYREFANRKTLCFEFNGKLYFVKIHRGIGLVETFKNLVTLKWPVWGAEQEWLAIQKLQALEVATMTPVALGVKGYLPWRKTSFLITEALINTTSLEDIAKQWMLAPPAFTYKRKLIEAVAVISAQLHQAGINHRDFYICHFLLDNAYTGSNAPMLFLIDLHRAQLRTRTPLRWVIKDVGSLYFSACAYGLTRQDKYRFIKHYMNMPLRVALQHTAFWQQVDQRARVLLQQQGSMGV